MRHDPPTTLIVVPGDTMGRGDDALGTTILGGFLRTLAAARVITI
jgi:hypothetical protein